VQRVMPVVQRYGAPYTQVRLSQRLEKDNKNKRRSKLIVKSTSRNRPRLVSLKSWIILSKT